MNKEDIICLDQEVKVAHEELVRINNQYNDLLTNIFMDKNKKELNVPNQEEISLKNKKKKINLIYWLLVVLIFICRGAGLLSSTIYTILFFGNLGINIFLLYKVDKKKKNLKDNNCKNQQSINKDELYELLCKAREKYHNLRKKREEIEGLEELIIDSDEDKIAIGDNDVKQLMLDK